MVRQAGLAAKQAAHRSSFACFWIRRFDYPEQSGKKQASSQPLRLGGAEKVSGCQDPLSAGYAQHGFGARRGSFDPAARPTAALFTGHRAAVPDPLRQKRALHSRVLGKRSVEGDQLHTASLGKSSQGGVVPDMGRERLVLRPLAQHVRGRWFS